MTKQLLTLLFSVIFITIGTINVNAQYRWKKLVLPGDELLGNTTDTMYLYKFNNGDKFSYYEVSKFLTVKSGLGLFDYDYNNKLFFKIGYYDKNMKLLSSDVLQFKVINDTPNTAYYETKNDDGLKLILFLKNYHGFVRLVGKLYGQGFFDITLPCINNQPTSESKTRNKTFQNKNRHRNKR